MKTILTKHQTKTERITIKDSKLYPEYNGRTLAIELRYDDECGNGHNSFSITGSAGGRHGIGGCIHEFIIEQAPEYRKFIKWHLTSSDGPMHYVANSMYHAKEVKKNTVVSRYDERLTFEDCPFTFDLSKKLNSFLESYTGETIEVIAVAHRENGIEGKYQFNDNYTFKGCTEDWYSTLFNDKREAEEMAEALMDHQHEIVRTIGSYENEKIPDLRAARDSAVWPEAQLADFTEEKLAARLKGLLTEFRESMQELSFTY